MWLLLPLPAVFSIVMSSGTSEANIYAVAKNVTLSSEAIDTAYSIINGKQSATLTYNELRSYMEIKHCAWIDIIAILF